MTDIVRASVAEIIANILELPPGDAVGPDFRIAEELDSLQVVEFIVAVTERYGVRYGEDYADIEAISSVASFADWVSRHATRSQTTV